MPPAPTIPFLPSEWSSVFFHLICPSMGCLLATAMFAAPITDLRLALLRHSLGDLNPRPWAVMTGNCIGWCAYAYYIQDPFILASNIPGFILSLWLNAGAAKLQYKQITTPVPRRRGAGSQEDSSLEGPSCHRPTLALRIKDDDGDIYSQEENPSSLHSEGCHPLNHSVHHMHCSTTDSMVFTPQEMWWFRVMIFWSLALVWVGWLAPVLMLNSNPAATVGLLVNMNLIFFYGAPLQTIRQVIRQGHSNSIHPPSMMMAIGNAGFWLLYGVALWDPVLMVPNSIGLTLGLCQVALCAIYPRRPLERLNSEDDDNISMKEMEQGEEEPFEDLPLTQP